MNPKPPSGHATFAAAIPKFHGDLRKRWWSCRESNPPQKAL
jgi:hypothetical protein